MEELTHSLGAFYAATDRETEWPSAVGVSQLTPHSKGFSGPRMASNTQEEREQHRTPGVCVRSAYTLATSPF